LPAEQEAWERRIAGKTNVWVTLNLKKAISTGGATFTNLPDQSVLATEVNPTYDTTRSSQYNLQNITAILLESCPIRVCPRMVRAAGTRPAISFG